MKTCKWVALAAMFTFYTAAAHAAPSERVDDTVSYNFEDDLVKGDLVAPNGEILMARRGGKKESLVRVREHFVRELLQSIEDL